MRSSTQFVAGTVALVLLGTAAALPALDSSGDRAVLGAGLLALGTQLPAHFLLLGWKRRSDRFVAAILGGFAARAAALAAGVLFFALPRRAEPVPFLLALGAFLVGSVVLESAIEHRRQRSTLARAEPR